MLVAVHAAGGEYDCCGELLRVAGLARWSGLVGVSVLEVRGDVECVLERAVLDVGVASVAPKG
jgi:hypothetical protein